MTTETIHETVRAHYAAAAVRAGQGTSCCGPSEDGIGASLYSALELDAIPNAAGLASLVTPGETRAVASGLGLKDRQAASLRE